MAMFDSMNVRYVFLSGRPDTFKPWSDADASRFLPLQRLVVREPRFVRYQLLAEIKITINGKEYARVEDVPEEFRALLKNSDRDGILGGNPELLLAPWARDQCESSNVTKIILGDLSLTGLAAVRDLPDSRLEFSGLGYGPSIPNAGRFRISISPGNLT